MELAVSAPLLANGLIDDRGAIVVALAIGLAFGWALERAGLGSARKLMGQFYLTDLTVFKVMFSAIVTAMLGTFWLARLGILDLSQVYVPETYLLPQLAGGLVFGAGFALAGLCPGTSCVAAATGRGDGVAVVAGMFSAVLVTGLAFASLQRFYESGARGSFTLPQLVHLPYGIVVGGVVLVALSAFVLAERLTGSGTPIRASALRIPLAGAAVVLGVVAAVAGSAALDHNQGRVDAIELAQWIRDRHPDVRIVDLRSTSAFDDYHVPTAVRIPFESLRGTTFSADDTIIVYGSDEKQAAEAQRLLQTAGFPRVYVLRNGLIGWIDDVMNPTLASGSSPEAKAAFVKTREISRYFGGVPRVDVSPATGTSAGSSSVQRVRRRGC